MKHLISITAIAAALFVSCSSDDPSNNGEIRTLSTPKYSKNISLSRGETSINQALNDFGIDLFAYASSDKAFRDNNDNIAYSPLTSSLTLGLLANSADDATAATIAEMLGCESLDDLTSTCNKLMLFLPHKDNGSTLSLANSVWVDAQHTLPSQYISGINSNFNAEVFSFDFNRPDMTSLVNNWCAQKTSNRISNVIKEFEPQSMFNIFSAMYFDGTWKTKFDKALTSDATFHGTLGDNTVKMMRVKDNFKAYRSNSFEAVVLPFKGEKTDMILVLPNEGSDFDSFASQFNANRFNDMTQHCSSYELTVKLPRFDIEQDFDITSAYEHYGLNLRGVNLQKAAVGTLNLYAQHFTSISVDEDGAKIAAVEKVSGYTSVADGVLTFDRPFLMFVRNNVSGTILMAARIGNL